MIYYDEDKNYNFLIVSCDEGEMITSYVDGEDIKGFSSFSIAYCPMGIDRSKFRTITLEENADYMILQEKALEEERKEIEENRKK